MKTVLSEREWLALAVSDENQFWFGLKRIDVSPAR